ncbi:MAG: hypothetical protein AVDCRST_MAG93-2974 [uncultured Chloroflexia bacterium]|uniref:Transposase n=1 Tax=uncultured Chloroflexia bacterium TaxID=1672391 RepID=A0A6J4JGM1_9CHLR|nr:MAG: hypothetical protein AVDCRST_MAG93-2974 [uncultured Chloroflexia bacterium]
MDLTDEQWEILEKPLIPVPPRPADGKGPLGGARGTSSKRHLVGLAYWWCSLARLA